MANDLKTFRLEEARAIALSAQGFGEPRPEPGDVNIEHFRDVTERLNIVQIDSVNVLVRAQYMPFFSRLGPYPLDLLHRFAYEERNLFEYTVHQASLVPIDHFPMIRYRMTAWRPWQGWVKIIDENPGMLDSVVGEITERGPLEVADIEEKGKRYHYWNFSGAKIVLETLLSQGKLAVADRVKSARRYDLIDRVVPDEIAAEPALTDIEAHRKMMRFAIRALGIGTAADCADYYRIKRVDATRAIEHLVSTGEVERVKVDGVKTEMFAPAGLEAPDQPIDTCALVSPFDPVAWYRNRIEWLFDFEYRIEIYTPVKKRKYGYYVLPFLLGDRFAARVDLKADRQKSVLRVPGAFLEAGCDEEAVAHNLASELRLMADWLSLDRIVIGRRGKLTSALRQAIKAL